MFGCAGSLLLHAGFHYLWQVGELIWHLIRRVRVTKRACYLLFFKSEKILQRVVGTIRTIFNNNNNIMNCLPFLMTLSYQISNCLSHHKLASHPWVSQASRMPGRESRTDAEGPVSVGISQTQGHVPKREDLLLLACGFHSTCNCRTTFMCQGQSHRANLAHPL